MKIFKPQTLSLVTRCFEFRDRIRLGVSVLLQADLSTGSVRLERDLWKFWASRPEAAGVLEEGVVRNRAEYLVGGHAYPHGTDGRACLVGARVGELEKVLRVTGDRVWAGDRPTEPQPFDRMPLGWARSFGGTGFELNPWGRGLAPGDAEAPWWLPNVESPASLVVAPSDRPAPAGFGPLDPMWPQRARWRGTYDAAWLQQQFPAVASDTDWRMFNVASEDQQQAAPFRGDERCAFRNMHPVHALLEGRLPGLHTRSFVMQRDAEGSKFRELPMRLNTLWLFPEDTSAILVFQGLCDVAEDDASDVQELLVAMERMDAPRDAAHYMAVREKRLDRTQGALESLREDDLMPADLVVPLFDLTPPEDRARARALQRAQTQRTRDRALVATNGLDPDQGHGPPPDIPMPPPVRTLDDLIRAQRDAEVQAEQLRVAADQTQADTRREIAALFAREGLDFKPIEREMAGLETRGPPKPFSPGITESFKGMIDRGRAAGGDVAELEQMLGDAKIQADWRRGDEQQMQNYRLHAHYQPAADRLDGEQAQAVRRRVAAQHAQRASMAGWDLTGADLSGLDLAGADLAGALMERANLTGTRLAGARLQGAVLAHATLVGTQCEGANLSGANLGGAHVEKSVFQGADLREAVFVKAMLRELDWRETRIDGIRLEDARFAEIDFSGAQSQTLLTFVRQDFRGCRFTGARLQLCSFIGCDLQGVDLRGAAFQKCAFVAVRAEDADLRELRIASGCFVQGCRMARADLRDAHLPQINFRGADLAGARLSGAVLTGSDFSACDLRGADLRRARLQEARFVRARLEGARLASAHLVDAVFQHAQLDGADFRRTNLFQSDFARVRVGTGVHFDDAFMPRMRVLPRHRPPEHAPS